MQGISEKTEENLECKPQVQHPMMTSVGTCTDPFEEEKRPQGTKQEKVLRRGNVQRRNISTHCVVCDRTEEFRRDERRHNQ
jgi:hypothetical protein